jgi:flagellar assembly protein FliH
MSSSAPRLQPAPVAEPAPFCYAEAQPSSAASAEQAAEERNQRQQAEAFEHGRESAQEQLRAALDATLVRGREQIGRALDEFARERASYYRRIEGEVVQLALAIARKILHREMQLDPHVLAGIVRVTLEKLDAGTRVDLYVHPAEATDWRHYFACQMEGVPAPEVHEDPAVPAGECRIETSLGSTEVGFELQLKEIETGLLDLLAERPETASATSSATAPTPAAGPR